MPLDFEALVEEGVPIVDSRRCLVCSRADWQSAERRSVHLLRDVADVPISVDEVVLHPIASCSHANSSFHLIGIALPNSPELVEMAESRRLHGFKLPSSVKQLGFDVADPRTSALSNCGMGRSFQLPAFVEYWSTKLNEYYLFGERDAAYEFASVSDVRIAPHAPFLVIALYQVVSSNAGIVA